MKQATIISLIMLGAAMMVSCSQNDNEVIIQEDEEVQVDPMILSGTWRLTRVMSWDIDRYAEPDDLIITIDEENRQITVDNKYSDLVSAPCLDEGYFIKSGVYKYDVLSKKELNYNHTKEIITTISIDDYIWGFDQYIYQQEGCLFVIDGITTDVPYYRFEKVK